MESNKKRKMKITSLKTLTDLPETIIHDILCLIPFKEAVRASVLSRSWRRRWRSIPDLDLSEINNLVATQIILLHSSPLRLLKADFNSDALNFLPVQSGPTLRTLHLFDCDNHLDSIARSFPNLTHLQLKGGFYFGCFSGFKTLQTIHLEDLYFYDRVVSVLFSSCPLLEAAALVDIYSLESQQLDIFAPNLRSLKLKDAVQGKLAITIDADFSGLKNLRILHLESITFAANLSKLFSACHFLEEVNLEEIRLQETQHLDIIAPNLRLLKLVNVGSFWNNKHLVIITGDGDFSGLKNLRSLHLQHVSFGTHAHLSKLFSSCSLLVEVTLSGLRLGDKKQCLDIAAPNLRRLGLVKMDYDDCLDDFTISSAPVLEVVLLDPRLSNCYWVGPRGDCKLMGMPNVKVLELWIRDYFEHPHIAHIPRRLPISFDHLKIMILDVSFELESEALLTLCLLRSSPNLQEFEYLAGYYSTKVAGLGPDFWEAQENLGVFDKLQTVKILVYLISPLLEDAALVDIYSSESQQQLDIFAPNLRALKLKQAVQVKLAITIDGNFSGLKNLRILHLESITFAAHLSKLFSACHFLEEVNLINIRLQETQHLDIIAPNLRLLKFVNVRDFSVNKQLVITGDGDFSGLKNLRSLHLQHVSFGAHAHLSKLFSACSMLMEVTLSGLRLGGKKQCLDFAAPNLRWLELVGIDYDNCLDDFTISSAPVLEVVLLDPRLSNYYWVGPKGDCKLMGMPNLKKLKLWIRDYIEDVK